MTPGARLQAAIDAYRDPWQDGREPSGPGQFANNLPLLPLPIVPVERVVTKLVAAPFGAWPAFWQATTASPKI